MNAPASRYWLAIRLTNLPLAALALNEMVAVPAVVMQKKRVIYANALAQAAGVKSGMDGTTAQLLSGCQLLARKPEQEQAMLQALLQQFYQFTPYIQTCSSEPLAQSGLLLELSSCLQLFGGLVKLCEKIFTQLAVTPCTYDYGLAHSAQAAWLLSLANYPVAGNETRAVFIERLNQLPIGVLCDYPAAMEALLKMGFASLGDLALQISANSISSFKKRLGAEFTELLCELYQIEQNFQQATLFSAPRHSYQPEEWFEAGVHFEYPVNLVQQLEPAIESLLQQLSHYLRKRQHQCQAIEWRIADIYHHQEYFQVKSDEPQSHWQLFYDLSLIQFNNQDLPFEVDSLTLVCQYTMPLQQPSRSLDFEQRGRKARLQDFAVTIAKLKARLGEAAVYKLSYGDSTLPELTNLVVSLAEKSQQQLPAVHANSLRPAWLLSSPALIEQRHNRLYWQGYLETLVGPERLLGNWWNKAVARDYFLAKRQDHLHLWIFFDLYQKQWYVHGVFA